MRVDSILYQKGDQIIALPPDATVDTAVKLLSQLGIGAVVVCDKNETLCGVLAERDIIQGLAERGSQVLQLPISEIMRSEVTCCTRDSLLHDIMGLMTDRRVRHVPVQDSAGKLCGLISIGDMVKAHIDEIEAEARGLREYIAMA